MMRRILHTDMDLNKGAWRPAEDFLLKEYIEAHGEGNWRTLPLNAGLLRSGRSCRLRWMNYLRPNLKRGHITPEEEELIIRLHKLLGNRWSLIAGRMPGRTDNEIKNYWNTHLSKKLCDHKRSLDPSHNQEECAPAKKVATGKKNINNNGHFGSAELSPRNDQDTGYSVRKQTTSWYDEVERFLMEAEEPSKLTNIHCCDVCTDWTNYANCKQFKWETGSNVCHAEVQPNILSVIPAGMITLLLELNYSLHLNGNPQMPNPITVCTTPQNLWYMVNDHIQPSQFAEQSLEALTDPYF